MIGVAATHLLAASVVFCQARPAELRGRAEAFVAALNSRDVEAMVRLSADTVFIREQKWASAPDGAGFALGSTTDSVLTGHEAARAFYATLVARVHIRTPTATDDPRPRAEMLGGELKGAESRWGPLTFFVFMRGEGDVEHTAIVGIDPATRKLAAFYIN
jgi:hypothetical protein